MLDVTNSDQVKNAVARAHAHFGRLDIIINNAGYALAGAIEESDEADIRAQFETNFFGSLQVIPAVRPLLRQQGNGHILGVSSVFAWAAPPYLAPIPAPISSERDPSLDLNPNNGLWMHREFLS